MSPPFTTRVLESPFSVSNTATLLPATCHIKGDEICVPQPDLYFLENDLSVKRLEDVIDWLWICGRPMPPRALHYQRLIERTIYITEKADMHLVWARSAIYLKPIPLYLLDLDFWTAYILPHMSKEETEEDIERKTRLTACARGFLFSYTALISYESDFRIARELGLIPATISWHKWQTLSGEILRSHCFSAVSPRYWYGELRLTRLNKIYRFQKGSMIYGYSSIGAYMNYIDLLTDNFAVLGTILAYVVIVLSAMQVGLATNHLQVNSAFQSATYGFTVFSILAPLIAGMLIVLAVMALFIYNWIATTSYEKKRFREMGVERNMMEKRYTGKS
jgi:hypothetical protein